MIRIHIVRSPSSVSLSVTLAADAVGGRWYDPDSGLFVISQDYILFDAPRYLYFDLKRLLYRCAELDARHDGIDMEHAILQEEPEISTVEWDSEQSSHLNTLLQW